MLGAIIGDIVGSRFEFNNTNNEHFRLFTPECSYTDDTILTVAIASAILNNTPYKDALLEWGRKYPFPMGGYGGRFAQWLQEKDPKPYNSYGNGSAMRVSPVAFHFKSLDDVLAHAEMTALPTHNHPEGIKGAKAVAHAIWLFRNGGTVSDLINLSNEYYPNYSLDNVGKFDETCMGTVPLCFRAIYASSNFEDAIRKAIAMGGDSDTIGAITGSIAEARWGVPWTIGERALGFLPRVMKSIIYLFYDL